MKTIYLITSAYYVSAFAVFTLIVIVIQSIIFKVQNNIGLRKNQEAWDEYSKDMTYPERYMEFADWLKQRKAEMGNRFYYIPNKFHTPPKYFECYVNGIHYRGTLEDVSEKTKIPINFLREFERNICPIEIEFNERIYKT